MLDRREFLAKAASIGIILALPNTGCADSGVQTINIQADPTVQLASMPIDFTGFSYETGELQDLELFSPNNRSLIKLFDRIGPIGVLRIGANSGDRSDWDTYTQPDSPLNNTQPIQPIDPFNPTAPPPVAKVRVTVTPEMLFNLSGFLKECGWSVIWQLNPITGTALEARDEAKAVAHALGPYLFGFEIGNEPDLYASRADGKDWTFDKYMETWHEFTAEVKKSVPTARFSGPDTTYISGWPGRFSVEAGADLTLLTHHYYPMGPAGNPNVTIERMLKPNRQFDAQSAGMVRQAQKANISVRMTEGNSCWGGGQPGVSDVFASALWGADYMLRVGQAGYSGVNFHGGGYRIYAPIVGNSANGFFPRPLYYGMLFASQFSQSTFIQTTSDTQTANVTAVAAKAGGGWLVAVINKDLESAYDLRIQGLPGSGSAKAWRLSGLQPSSSSGITLAGAEVEQDGSWSPRTEEPVTSQNGLIELGLPAASAVLLFAG